MPHIATRFAFQRPGHDLAELAQPGAAAFAAGAGRRSTYAREGIEIDTSTLADWVGGCVVPLDPILALLKAHVLRGKRIHADDSVLQQHAERMIV